MATFYNQATLSYNGTVASSNITAGEILEVLSASKTAVPDTYSQGSDNVFIISIVNTGSSCYNGLTVTDDLGEYSFGDAGGTAVPLTYREGSLIYYVNGVQQPAPAVTSMSPLTVTGINVPAGGNATLVYAAETNSFAPMGAEAAITNTAIVSGAGSEAVAASATIAYKKVCKYVTPAMEAEADTILDQWFPGYTPYELISDEV